MGMLQRFEMPIFYQYFRNTPSSCFCLVTTILWRHSQRGK